MDDMELTPEERAHAVRTVAAHARHAADLTTLLDMLGLEAREARAASAPVTPDVPRQATEPAASRGFARQVMNDLEHELIRAL